jgi:prepilin-type N-terminal cleavage/methylation domain-containing protein
MINPAGASRGQNGFTLLELVLVAAILGVLAAVTVPGFVQSIRGNRLRTGARTVASSGRYARSMAALRQQPVGLFFDLKENKVSVRRVKTENSRINAQELPGSGEDRSRTSGWWTEADFSRQETSRSTGQTAQVETGGDAIEVSHQLEGVSIDYVEKEGGAQRILEGRCHVVYGMNGRCTPYTVMLVGQHDNRLRVQVDALAVAEIDEVE